MTDPQLLDYVRLHTAQGKTRDTIKQSLISSGGWSSSDIDEAFSAVLPGEAESGTATPISQPAVSVETTEPVIDDVEKSTNSYLWKHDKIWIMLYVILVLGSAVYICYAQINLYFFFIPVAIGYIAYFHLQTKIKREFTQQFGASIGFVYSRSADLSSVNGKLFKLGHSQKIYDVLSGVESGRDSRIFSYSFTIGYGKGSRTYGFTIFETAFVNEMPDIVLTSNEIFSTTGLALFDGSEHVQLEGDFNKFFTLKVPKGYETDAYEIFPPNVMADLIDKARNLNFEFNGNKLYVYAAELILVREKLQAMFDLAEYLDNIFARSTRGVDVGQDLAK